MSNPVVLAKNPYTFPPSGELRIKNVDLSETASLLDSDLPFILDRPSLCNYTGIPLQTLSFFLLSKTIKGKRTYVKNTQYQEFKIPKPQNAKDRELGVQRYRFIQNPCPALKRIQKRLAEDFWGKFPLPEYVVAFRSKYSIQDVAALHAGRPLILSIDLHNFFPSIKGYMLVEFLVDQGYPQNIARDISELCTFHAFLPQGSPCSPVISNVIGFHRFDEAVRAAAEAKGYLYSRYADDLILSTTDESAASWETAGGLHKEICGIIGRSGFQVSHDKTKFMRPHMRQRVLGSVVNECPPLDDSENSAIRLRIPMSDYLNTRAKLHDALLNGADHAGARHQLSGTAFLRHLNGYINSYVKKTDYARWLKLSPILDIIIRRHHSASNSLPTSSPQNGGAGKVLGPPDMVLASDAEISKLLDELEPGIPGTIDKGSPF